MSEFIVTAIEMMPRRYLVEADSPSEAKAILERTGELDRVYIEGGPIAGEVVISAVYVKPRKDADGTNE